MNNFISFLKETIKSKKCDSIQDSHLAIYKGKKKWEHCYLDCVSVAQYLDNDPDKIFTVLYVNEMVMFSIIDYINANKTNEKQFLEFCKNRIA